LGFVAGVRDDAAQNLARSASMPHRVKNPCVYILASRRNGTLYIGVTSDLPQRVALHKQDLIEGFTKKYRVHCLVYYEMHPTMEAAIRPCDARPQTRRTVQFLNPSAVRSRRRRRWRR
jgi:putative endonuclease